MKPDDKSLPAQASVEEQTKKKYVTPELIVHGSVEKITENTSRGPNNDGQTIAPNQRS
ncbi:MAG TPA: hypothetical protein VK463_04390 [Desulfomonilaceae bacterium]|nr:hypothetical protein [Desulfomonilaceae bacterium]